MAMIEIRAARRGDIPAMAAIVCAWEQETEWMPASVNAAEVEAMLDAAFDARELHVAAEASGGPVAGYISVDPAIAKIGALYIAARGQGWGSRLMGKAKNGRSFLWLQTHQPNQAAHRFYRRHGFEITAELPPDAAGSPAQYKMEWQA